MCSTNPETYKLLEGMYQDLMDANKGVKYFHLSTDEAWFIGKADNGQCHEAAAGQRVGESQQAVGGIHAERPRVTCRITAAR